MNDNIRVDIERFRGMLQNISASYKPISDEVIERYVADIEDILTGSYDINDRFDNIGTGAFKECYSLNDDFVIKFVSEDNNTNSEENLFYRAVEDEVAEVFLPTWYCYIDSRSVELKMLEDDMAYCRYYYDESKHTYVENPDYVNTIANCIIIQPRSLRTVSENSYLVLPRNELDYNKAPIFDAEGNKVDCHTAHKFRVSSQTWLQDIVDAYGLEYFNRLAQFLTDNEVYDLHVGNIGYYTREDGKVVPVIFDCLSREQRSQPDFHKIEKISIVKK